MGGEKSLMMSALDLAPWPSAQAKWEVAEELCSQITTQGSIKQETKEEVKTRRSRREEKEE
jgi:hypothetical protein